MIGLLSAASKVRSTAPRSIIFLLFCIVQVQGWKQCEGGGICPNFAFCCPSARPGVSSCISMRYNKDPADAIGECCDETTGCPYGFSCAVKPKNSEVNQSDMTIVRDSDLNATKLDQNVQYCKIDKENPPTELYHDQSSYKMCQIPNPSMTEMHGFPILPEAVSQAEEEGMKDQVRRRALPVHSLAYYSSHGDLFECDNPKDSQDETSFSSKSKIRKAVVMIHGSLRNADDYFCVAHSLVPEEDRGSVLIVAPRFLAPSDLKQKRMKNHQNQTTEFLYWQHHQKPPDYPISHSWRYGADALNSPISSYEAIDRLVEHLVSISTSESIRCFPNLRQVTVVGHSAGGQLAQRWALLSNARTIPWTSNNDPKGIDIRAVVANPRSYCYLNEKRMVMDTIVSGINEAEVQWKVPTASNIRVCPEYNQWTWGLESGGALDKVVPYKVRRMKEVSVEELALRYASRKVFYLTGEYDDIDKDDNCATRDFQGRNRHERALCYFASLNAYFGTSKNSTNTTINALLRHELRTIPETPHDYILMFQSAAGRIAIID